jgi:predicted DNA-binding transcriptional regulator AlpA
MKHYTVKELSEKYGIPNSTLRDAIKRPNGPECVRIGRSIRISAAEWQMYLERNAAEQDNRVKPCGVSAPKPRRRRAVRPEDVYVPGMRVV